MQIILYAIPAFLVLIALELVLEVRRGTRYYRVNDAITSMTTGALSQAANAVKLIVPFTLYIWFYQHWAITEIPLTWLSWVFAFIVFDFCYYWNHRCGHEMNILWAAHVVHHNSEDYNLSTALRQTSTSFLSAVFYIPMAVAGFSPEQMVTVGALNLVYQFWVHTQHIDKLGWFDRVFVSPSNHRVHHAQNTIYIDRNYGGVFILWDRLFGSFQDELDDDKPIFGIRGALRSWNPLWANLQVYRQLWQDAVHTNNLWHKLTLWFRRTGWRPPDVVERYPLEKGALADFEKFDTGLSIQVKIYALLQYVIMALLVVVLMAGLDSIKTSYQLGLIAYLLLSGFSVGALMEHRSYANGLELSKLLVLSVTAILWLDSGRIAFTLIGLAALSLLLLFRIGRPSIDLQSLS